MSILQPTERKDGKALFKHFHANELPMRTASLKDSDEPHSRGGRSEERLSYTEPPTPLTALDEEQLEKMMKSLSLYYTDKFNFFQRSPTSPDGPMTATSQGYLASGEESSELESSSIQSPRSSTFSLNTDSKSFRNTFGLYSSPHDSLPVSERLEWRQRWIISQWRETYERQAEGIIEFIPHSDTEDTCIALGSQNGPVASPKDYGSPYFLWYWIPEEESTKWRRYGIRIRRRHPHCVLSHHPSIVSVFELYCTRLETFLYLDPFSHEWSRITPDDPMKISNSGHVLIRLEGLHDMECEGLEEIWNVAFGRMLSRKEAMA